MFELASASTAVSRKHPPSAAIPAMHIESPTETGKMKAFVCVYLHNDPPKNAFCATQASAHADPVLKSFLAAYGQQNSVLDWGDDPGFFAASAIFGNPAKASWGVYRRDVRCQLVSGDFILWFCARKDPMTKGSVDYYFVGCTTVAETITRVDLWTNPKYQPYQSFYNTLARPSGSELIRHETIHPFHADWERRAEASYVLFDACPLLSAVNLSKPLLVATKHAGAPLETWLSPSNSKVAQIESAIFTNLGIYRRLRTSNRQQPHRQIALHNAPIFPTQDRITTLTVLRQTVLSLV